MEIKTYKPMVRVMTVITIVAVFAAVYFFWQVRVLSQNPSVAAQDDASKVVKKVGDLIVLPEGEQPTIATVTDLAPLKDQPFFAHAEINDKVLIYQTAAKAILYRPSANKIIEVAPINLGASQNPPASNQNQVQVTPVPTTKSGTTSTKR